MEKRESYLTPGEDSPAPFEDSPWISIEEMALATGRSATTVRGLLQAGIIPGRRHGSRWYVHRASFMRWQQGEPATEAKAADLESLTAALQAVLDGRVRIVVTFEPVGQMRR